MPWVTFTEDDIKARLSARELSVYEETARAEFDETEGENRVPDDSPERLAAVHAQTLGQFRGAIRANPYVTALGPAGTLPDFCIAWAAIIARVGLIALNPVQEGVTDPRRDEYRDAVKGLESLRSMNAAAFDLSDPSGSGSASASYGGSQLLDF